MRGKGSESRKVLNLRKKNRVTRSHEAVINYLTRGLLQKQTKPAEDKRSRCLEILGLDPRRSYNPDELKAAYRKKEKRPILIQGGLKRNLLR
jgi:hypothetical protein